MNQSLNTRGLVCLLCTVLTVQPLLASMSESNVWTERQKAMQVAALPAASTGSLSVINQLPSMRSALATIPKFISRREKHFSPVIQSLIESIPLSAASIQQVFDAKGSASSPIILLQDVHLNSEAQKSMADVLQRLVDDKKISLVGVEGAFRPFDFSRFRKYSDKALTKKIADAFLAKNLIAAPAFVGLTSVSDLPPFVGVDDLAHYRANVNAYLSTLEKRDAVKKQLTASQEKLTAEKQNEFSAELKHFDSLRISYRKGDLPIGQYVRQLTKIHSSDDFVLEQFLAAYDLESTLDFQRADAERRAVVERLTKALSQRELSDLLSESIAYRSGEVGFGRYYADLRELATSKGISFRQTPAFDSYVRYVLLCDGIKPDQLFHSIANLEREISSTLIKTPRQRALMNQSEQLTLGEKIIRFELSPDEWSEYQQGERLPALKEFEHFYEEADVRSEHMTEKILRGGEGARGREGEKDFSPVRPLAHSPARVLVVGGFHTPQIAERLKQQNIPFIIVSPKVTKLDDSGSAYLSIFAHEKESLNELFKGEKLFVSPWPVASVGTNMLATGQKTDPFNPNEANLLVAEEGLQAVPTESTERKEKNGVITVETPDVEGVVSQSDPANVKAARRRPALSSRLISEWKDVVAATLAKLSPSERSSHNAPLTRMSGRRGLLSIGRRYIAGGTLSLGFRGSQADFGFSMDKDADRASRLPDRTALAINALQISCQKYWARFLHAQGVEYVQGRFGKGISRIRINFSQDNDRTIIMTRPGDNLIEIDDDAVDLHPLIFSFLLNHEMNATESRALYEDLRYYAWLKENMKQSWEAALNQRRDISSQPYFKFLEENFNKGDQEKGKEIAIFMVQHVHGQMIEMLSDDSRELPIHAREKLSMMFLLLQDSLRALDATIFESMNSLVEEAEELVRSRIGRGDNGRNSFRQRLHQFIEQFSATIENSNLRLHPTSNTMRKLDDIAALGTAGGHDSAVTKTNLRAKESMPRRTSPASVFFKSLGQTWGHPLIAPFWEWIYRAPVIIAALGSNNPLLIFAIGAIAAFKFGKDHEGRSHDQKVWLAAIGVIFSIVALVPIALLDQSAQCFPHKLALGLFAIFVEMSAHMGYNVAWMRGWLPEWIPVAAIENEDDEKPWKYASWYVPLLDSKNEVEQEIAFTAMVNDLPEHPKLAAKLLPKIISIVRSTRNPDVTQIGVELISSIDFSDPTVRSITWQKIRDLQLSGAAALGLNAAIRNMKALELSDEEIEAMNIAFVTTPAEAQILQLLALTIWRSEGTSVNKFISDVSWPLVQKMTDEKYGRASEVAKELLRLRKKQVLSARDRQFIYRSMIEPFLWDPESAYDFSAADLTKLANQARDADAPSDAVVGLFEQGAGIVTWARGDIHPDLKNNLKDALEVVRRAGIKTVFFHNESIGADTPKGLESVTLNDEDKAVVREFELQLKKMGVAFVYLVEDPRTPADLQGISDLREIENRAREGRTLVLGGEFVLSKVTPRFTEPGISYVGRVGPLLAAEKGVLLKSVFEMTESEINGHPPFEAHNVSGILSKSGRSIALPLAGSALAGFTWVEPCTTPLGRAFDLLIYRKAPNDNGGGGDEALEPEPISPTGQSFIPELHNLRLAFASALQGRYPNTWGHPFKSPLWEWVYRVPVIIAALGSSHYLFIAAIAILAAAKFGSDHEGRSPPQKRALMAVGLVFSIFAILPIYYLDPSAHHFVDRFAIGLVALAFEISSHLGYNLAVVKGLLPKWAMASVGNQGSSSSFTHDSWRKVADFQESFGDVVSHVMTDLRVTDKTLAENIDKVRAEVLRRIDEKLAAVSGDRANDFKAAVKDILSNTSVHHYREVVQRFDQVDFVAFLQRIHTIVQDPESFGLPRTSLKKITLPLVIKDIPYSYATINLILKDLSLAGPAWDRVKPSQEMKRKLAEGKFTEALAELSQVKMGDARVADIKALCDVFQIDLSAFILTKLHSLSGDLQESFSDPIERALITDAFRQRFAMPIVDDVNDGMSQTIALAQVAKQRGIVNEKFAGKGFDGLAFFAQRNGRRVVIKANLPMDGRDAQLARREIIDFEASMADNDYLVKSAEQPFVERLLAGRPFSLIEVNEFIEGPNLIQYLSTIGADAKGFQATRDLLLQNAQLAYEIEKRGFVSQDYRNLTNLIVTKEGRLKLIDRGQIRSRLDPKLEPSALNHRDQFISACLHILTGHSISKEALMGGHENILTGFAVERFGEQYRSQIEQLISVLFTSLKEEEVTADFVQRLRDVAVENTASSNAPQITYEENLNYSALAQAIASDSEFLNQSVQKISPAHAGKAIQSIHVKSFLGKGKVIFLLELSYGVNDIVRVLAIGQQILMENPGLGSHYQKIIATDPEHKVTHVFGVQKDVTYAHPTLANYNEHFRVFTINFHEGVSLDEVSGALEALAGTPGHPSFKSRIKTESLEFVSRYVRKLGQLGFISPAEAREIMEAKASGDVARIQVSEQKLTALLLQLDQQAIATLMQFYKVTGYMTSDPRRNNVVVRVVNGNIEMKVIDYEDLKKVHTPLDLISSFDIFESQIQTGGAMHIVGMSVRPWFWTFTDDKSGFYEAVLQGLGEQEGLDTLKKILATGSGFLFASLKPSLEKFLKSKEKPAASDWQYAKWYLPMLESKNTVEVESALVEIANIPDEDPLVPQLKEKILSIYRNATNADVRRAALYAAANLFSDDRFVRGIIRDSLHDSREIVFTLEAILSAWNAKSIVLDSDDVAALNRALKFEPSRGPALRLLRQLIFTSRVPISIRSFVYEDSLPALKTVQESDDLNLKYIAKIILTAWNENRTSADVQEHLKNSVASLFEQSNKGPMLGSKEIEELKASAAEASPPRQEVSTLYEQGAKLIFWGKSEPHSHYDSLLSDILFVVTHNGVNSVFFQGSAYDNLRVSGEEAAMGDNDDQVKQTKLLAQELRRRGVNVVFLENPGKIPEDLESIEHAQQIEKAVQKGRVLVVTTTRQSPLSPLRFGDPALSYIAPLGALLKAELGNQVKSVLELTEETLSLDNIDGVNNLQDVFKDVKRSVALPTKSTPLGKLIWEMGARTKISDGFDFFIYRTKDRGSDGGDSFPTEDSPPVTTKTLAFPTNVQNSFSNTLVHALKGAPAALQLWQDDKSVALMDEGDYDLSAHFSTLTNGVDRSPVLLYVDPNKGMREQYALELQALDGFIVIQVGSVAEAVAKLEQMKKSGRPVDLLLSDFGSSGVSGTEMVQNLRRFDNSLLDRLILMTPSPQRISAGRLELPANVVTINKDALSYERIQEGILSVASRLETNTPEPKAIEDEGESPDIEALIAMLESQAATPKASTSHSAETTDLTRYALMLTGGEKRQPVVLHIDDMADMRVRVALNLEPDYTVVQAENGQQGLETLDAQLKKGPVDLIICDFDMPGFNGAQVYLAVEKSHPELLPRFLFLSSRSKEFILEAIGKPADLSCVIKNDKTFFEPLMKGIAEVAEKIEGKKSSLGNLVDHLLTLGAFGIARLIKKNPDMRNFSAARFVKAVSFLAAAAEASLLTIYGVNHDLSFGMRFIFYGGFFVIDYFLAWAANKTRGEGLPSVKLHVARAAAYALSVSTAIYIVAALFHFASDAILIHRRSPAPHVTLSVRLSDVGNDISEADRKAEGLRNAVRGLIELERKWGNQTLTQQGYSVMHHAIAAHLELGKVKLSEMIESHSSVEGFLNSVDKGIGRAVQSSRSSVLQGSREKWGAYARLYSPWAERFAAGQYPELKSDDDKFLNESDQVAVDGVLQGMRVTQLVTMPRTGVGSAAWNLLSTSDDSIDGPHRVDFYPLREDYFQLLRIILRVASEQRYDFELLFLGSPTGQFTSDAIPAASLNFKTELQKKQFLSSLQDDENFTAVSRRRARAELRFESLNRRVALAETKTTHRLPLAPIPNIERANQARSGFQKLFSRSKAVVVWTLLLSGIALLSMHAPAQSIFADGQNSSGFIVSFAMGMVGARFRKSVVQIDRDKKMGMTAHFIASTVSALQHGDLPSAIMNLQSVNSINVGEKVRNPNEVLIQNLNQFAANPAFLELIRKDLDGQLNPNVQLQNNLVLAFLQSMGMDQPSIDQLAAANIGKPRVMISEGGESPEILLNAVLKMGKDAPILLVANEFKSDKSKLEAVQRTLRQAGYYVNVRMLSDMSAVGIRAGEFARERITTALPNGAKPLDCVFILGDSLHSAVDDPSIIPLEKLLPIETRALLRDIDRIARQILTAA